MNMLVHSLQGEWLKTKRSLGAWLIIVGSLFTPAIVIVARLIHHSQLQALYSMADFWKLLWKNSWESMAVFFLPMAAILVTSLITQIEYRNNAWKQVHTLPLSPATIFFSKLLVILVLMSVFLVLFDVGVYLSAAVPWLLVRNVPYPRAPLPLSAFMADTGSYMIACLPIVAAQYLLSLRFKNFLTPIGVGFMTWVAALAALSWKFGYLVPYAYTMLTYLKDNPKQGVGARMVPLQWVSLGYTLLFTVGGYVLFVTNRQKG